MRGFQRLLPAAALIGLAATCNEPVEEEVYELLAVPTRNISVSASAAGAVEPIQTIEIKSKASGEIIEVLVDVGDLVNRGDRLVRVDPRVPRNALVQAEADLEVARAQLTNAEARVRRADALFESQSITEQEWEDARLNHANARAQLVRSERLEEDARIAFEDTEVRAASPGMILTRQVEVGTVIQSASSGLAGGAVLLTMANMDTVQVRTLVDETDIGKIAAGYAVTIRVDAYPNQPFEGVVLKIEPAARVEQSVTMFPVLVRIANQNALLRPGMNSEVEIEIGERTNVLAVPNIALRTERDYRSAAEVLGLDAEALARQLDGEGGTVLADVPMSAPIGDGSGGRAIEFFGQEITVAGQFDIVAVRGAVAKMEKAGGGFEAMQALNEEERGLLRDVRVAAGVPAGRGPRPEGSARPPLAQGGGDRPAFSGERRGPGGRARREVTPASLQADHIVFVMRNGKPTAVRIRTGLTDLDYTEVLSGLTPSDTLILLPNRPLGGSN